MIFGDIPKEFATYKEAKIVVIPVPFEKTTSYIKGTKKGPTAIIKASCNMELFDEVLGCEPYRIGVCTAGKIRTLAGVEKCVDRVVTHKKFPILLGGEHTITLPAVKALKKFYTDFAVVQLDAHADLREQYEGQGVSHACVMRRVVELGLPIVQVGTRSLSKEEHEFILSEGLHPFFAKWIFDNPNWIKHIISNIPQENIYLTVDVDVFDPSLVPATGTPEPGGLSWNQVVDFLSQLAVEKKLIGADFVELCPRDGSGASSFTIARLVYRLIGLINEKLSCGKG